MQNIPGSIPTASAELRVKIRQRSGLMGLIAFFNIKNFGFSCSLNNWQSCRLPCSPKRMPIMFYVPHPRGKHALCMNRFLSHLNLLALQDPLVMGQQRNCPGTSADFLGLCGDMQVYRLLSLGVTHLRF
jgi:hypothetical protein